MRERHQRTPKIAVVVTSHNRVDKTAAAMRGLYAQQDLTGKFEICPILVDAESIDGTADRISRKHPDVDVLHASSDTYWAQGMAIGCSSRVARSCEYILWLNDDVLLEFDALIRLLAVSRENRDEAIVVGAMHDKSGASTTYSGLKRQSWRPTALKLVEPMQSAVPIDTFNGNLVLVPRVVTESVGIIDGGFGHKYADLDYGLRATAAGIDVLLAPGWLGTCDRNSSENTWMDDRLDISARIKLLYGLKGYPFSPHCTYALRHGGVIKGGLTIVLTYGRAICEIARTTLRRRVKR